MKTDSAFLIPFVGLKDGHHHFDYELDNTFFEGYDFLDFNEAKHCSYNGRLLKRV